MADVQLTSAVGKRHIRHLLSHSQYSPESLDYSVRKVPSHSAAAVLAKLTAACRTVLGHQTRSM
ncbi:hypothetical protein N7497_010788 [Penicillium chrysogenum]|nr:hypothetical protein N7497_010788 [Penicillium chrysogenum]